MAYGIEQTLEARSTQSHHRMSHMSIAILVAIARENGGFEDLAHSCKVKAGSMCGNPDMVQLLPTSPPSFLNFRSQLHIGLCN